MDLGLRWPILSLYRANLTGQSSCRALVPCAPQGRLAGPPFLPSTSTQRQHKGSWWLELVGLVGIACGGCYIELKQCAAALVGCEIFLLN